MNHSHFWETNRFSDSQEIPRTLWNPKVHNRVLQVPATCPYSEPDYSSPCPPSNFLKIHVNTTLPSRPVSSKWSLSLRFPHQNPVRTSPLPHTCCMPLPSIPRSSKWFSVCSCLDLSSWFNFDNLFNDYWTESLVCLGSTLGFKWNLCTRVTCPTHLLLGLITPVIFGEAWKLRSSSS